MLPMPGCCWLCLMPTALHQQGICSLCYRQLPASPSSCPRCGLPAASGDVDCGRCLLRPPPWQALVAVTNYQPPLSLLVRQFKFQQITALSVMLARLILLSWLQQRRTRQLVRPEIVLAVPLHQRRAWRRGFNQADLLARKLAYWIGSDYSAQGLRRVRAADLQHQLSARARRKNLRGAFKLEIAVAGRHIAVVDDVVTTGSTVAEISRLLQAAGAASVQICCLCRTL
ncbi:DNA utilization protein GntX [Erwiniaceae bacterium BAC15a-03b]|uniref:DNA utilization protein GntX n=1 Tax=Winslowiella arboricola TaxID=2978220 RepID=A0A9J6PJG2_9GAMM|nr:DNA utilization protein GntX [Winslowiella arboricola]MCU5771876.1 DNA utilization protein GntX [Winslowiella arboricola]MCU5777506.1 DNA utilization protein GntX [Winslowiella arboricola]